MQRAGAVDAIVGWHLWWAPSNTCWPPREGWGMFGSCWTSLAAELCTQPDLLSGCAALTIAALAALCAHQAAGMARVLVPARNMPDVQVCCLW